MGQQATGLDFFNAQKQQKCCFFNWSNCLYNHHIWWTHLGCHTGGNSGCNTGTGLNSGLKTGSCK